MTIPATIDAGTSCCVPRITSTISTEEAEKVARVFKALGDPTRVRLLSSSPPVTAGRRASAISRSPSGSLRAPFPTT